MKRGYAHNKVSERITKKRIHGHDTHQSTEDTDKDDNYNYENKQQIILNQDE